MDSEVKTVLKAGQDVAEAAGEVLCPRCNANVREVGFTIGTLHYQAYLPEGKKVVKSYKSKSGLKVVRCLPCGAEVPVLAEVLVPAA